MPELKVNACMSYVSIPQPPIVCLHLLCKADDLSRIIMPSIYECATGNRIKSTSYIGPSDIRPSDISPQPFHTCLHTTIHKKSYSHQTFPCLILQAMARMGKLQSWTREVAKVYSTLAI